MKRLVKKYGVFNVAAFVTMAVGLILFLVTPLLLWLFEFDSDILGVLVFLVGLLAWIGGLIARKVRRGKQADSTSSGTSDETRGGTKGLGLP